MTATRFSPAREPDEPDPADPALWPNSTVWPDAWCKLLYSHRVSDASSSDYMVMVRVERGTGLQEVRAKAPIADIVDDILGNDASRLILLERLAAWSEHQNTRRLTEVTWLHRHARHTGDCGCFDRLLNGDADDGE